MLRMSWDTIGQQIVNLLISAAFLHIGWLAVLFEGKVNQPGIFDARSVGSGISALPAEVLNEAEDQSAH